MLIALLQLRRQEKNYQLRLKDSYLEKARKANDRLKSLIDASTELDDGLKSRLYNLLGAYDAAFADYVANQKLQEKVGSELMVAARSLEPAIETLKNHYVQELQRTARQMKLAAAALETGVVVAVLLLIVWVLMSISKSMRALQSFAAKVASGDLDAKPEGNFAGEFEALRKHLAAMVQQLKARFAEVEEKSAEAQDNASKAQVALLKSQEQEGKISQLLGHMQSAAHKADGIASRVATASEQLAALIGQVRKGAVVQKDRMTETSTALEQMSAAIEEVARNSLHASGSAHEARDKAAEGAGRVKEAVEAISTVRLTTEDMRQGMDRLGAQVQTIGEVMGVISEIADQTNLLALNAAIEAARAGDAGRGFAVVADEVRKLAEKTMQATKEVGESIEAIKGAARDNDESVRKTVAAVERSTNLASATGETQEDIVRLAENNVQQVEEIASASQEQSAATEQINRAVAEVNRIAGESADGMSESFEAVRDLSLMARELAQLIDHMLAEAGKNEGAQSPELRTA
ncbi:MAG: methyl-accepting chemotaxis protein [Desulfovibrionales bacterium]|nr:methyl-accepting chemotaxis protein [Desulfovibrionales bacterium]